MVMKHSPVPLVMVYIGVTDRAEKMYLMLTQTDDIYSDSHSHSFILLKCSNYLI